jgi:Acyl-CoA dehydrogenase, C-terminal domain
MTDAVRPADYLAYREAALGLLGRGDASHALEEFGLGQLLEEAGPDDDLTPVYAFLEAQGYLGAATPALGRLGLVGVREVASAGGQPVLGTELGASQLVAVAGLQPGHVVVVDLHGSGLVVAHDYRARATGQPAIADDYVSVVDIDRTTATTLVAEEAMNGRRAQLRARLQLGIAAELLGLVDRIFEDALAYAQQRVQFGRRIGSNQAMQHLLAWAATERHQLICLLDIAVATEQRGAIDAGLSAATKAMAGQVFHAVVQAATQTTGAIAFTAEYSLSRLHLRGLALDHIAGSSADLIADMGRRVRVEAVMPELFELTDAS